jgi:hypothetical protein
VQFQETLRLEGRQRARRLAERRGTRVVRRSGCCDPADRCRWHLLLMSDVI